MCLCVCRHTISSGFHQYHSHLTITVQKLYWSRDEVITLLVILAVKLLEMFLPMIRIELQMKKS